MAITGVRQQGRASAEPRYRLQNLVAAKPQQLVLRDEGIEIDGVQIPPAAIGKSGDVARANGVRNPV